MRSKCVSAYRNRKMIAYGSAAIHVHGDVAQNVTNTQARNILVNSDSAKHDFASGDWCLHLFGGPDRM